MLPRLLATCFIVLLLLGAAKRPVALPVEIERTIAASKPLSSAFLGIRIVRVKDGQTLYERNQDHLFIPASNTKLFSTALALNRLGQDYRFITSVTAEAPVDCNGNLPGDLVLVGRGDPSLSGRTYPYTKEPSSEDPLKPIAELADQLVAGGLRTVRGDVVGDDTRYPWVPYPGGWSADDGIWEYGAPVSALIVNDNRLDLTVLPGPAEGELAQLTAVPGFEFFTIGNRVTTTASGKHQLHIDGHPGTPDLEVWGSIPIGDEGVKRELGIADPAVFAAAALRDALIQRGVAVEGRAVARHRFIDDVADLGRGDPEPPRAGKELARRVSPPLIQLLQVTDKVSQNLHAEVMLREVGAVKRGMGTAEAGLVELDDFLAGIGIPKDQYVFVDGSGLSRSTLVSPHAVTNLLQNMYASPDRDAWVAMLPIGNEDGSLKNRFKGHPEAHAIHAKTGSLSHVRALSGYANSKRHGMLIFSLLINNYSVPDADVSKFLDNIGLKLLP